MTVDFRANPAVNRLGIPPSTLTYYWTRAEQARFNRQMGGYRHVTRCILFPFSTFALPSHSGVLRLVPIMAAPFQEMGHGSGELISEAHLVCSILNLRIETSNNLSVGDPTLRSREPAEPGQNRRSAVAATTPPKERSCLGNCRFSLARTLRPPSFHGCSDFYREDQCIWVSINKCNIPFCHIKGSKLLIGFQW